MAMTWRVQNDTSSPILVGSFGMQDNMQARMQLGPNQTHDFQDSQGHLRKLDVGHRMFVAWDSFSSDVVTSGVFQVDDARGTQIMLLVTSNGMDVAYSRLR